MPKCPCFKFHVLFMHSFDLTMQFSHWLQLARHLLESNCFVFSVCVCATLIQTISNLFAVCKSAFYNCNYARILLIINYSALVQLNRTKSKLFSNLSSCVCIQRTLQSRDRSLWMRFNFSSSLFRFCNFTFSLWPIEHSLSSYR